MKSNEILVKKIVIKTKRAVFSEVIGNNASIFLGEGYDFAELREYQIGDDIRHIDWIITAKLQKPYVKLFYAQREINVVCAFMLGGNSYFGARKSKQELMAEIGAIIGFSATKNGDPFTSYIFADNSFSLTPPTKRISAIAKTIGDVLSFESLGKKSDYKYAAKTLFERVKRRSLIFIIGDFLDEFDFGALAKKHEVIAVMVRDRLEEEPPVMGAASLVDPESGAHIATYIDEDSVKAYAADIKAKTERTIKHFLQNRIRFVKIYTDEEPFVKLLRLFGRK